MNIVFSLEVMREWLVCDLLLLLLDASILSFLGLTIFSKEIKILFWLIASLHTWTQVLTYLHRSIRDLLKISSAERF